jgi:hypothetical protein
MEIVGSFFAFLVSGRPILLGVLGACSISSGGVEAVGFWFVMASISSAESPFPLSLI